MATPVVEMHRHLINLIQSLLSKRLFLGSHDVYDLEQLTSLELHSIHLTSRAMENYLHPLVNQGRLSFLAVLHAYSNSIKMLHPVARSFSSIKSSLILMDQ